MPLQRKCVSQWCLCCTRSETTGAPGSNIIQEKLTETEDSMFPELGRGYSEQRGANRQLGQGNAPQVYELGHQVEQKPRLDQVRVDVPEVSSHPVLNFGDDHGHADNGYESRSGHDPVLLREVLVLMSF